MKRSSWIVYWAAAAAVVQLAVVTLLPVPALSDSRSSSPSSKGIVLEGSLQPNAAAYQIQLRPKLNNLFPLGPSSETSGIHLETAVLIKPLKTENLIVSLAAGTPLSNTETGTALRTSFTPKPIRLSGNRGPGTKTIWASSTQMKRTPYPSLADKLTTIDLEPHIEGRTNWYSKLGLAYSPSKQWTVRAVLSMEYSDVKNLPLLSSHIVDQSRIGMAIDVDYRILESMILGFDYGHYRSGQSYESNALAPKETRQDISGNDLTQGPFFSARLQIRF